MERRGRVEAERGRKRVRGYLGGELVFDTSMPLLVWEVPYYPAYYVPEGDVVADLRPNGLTERSPSRGIAEKLDVAVPGRVATDAAWRYPSPKLDDLRNHVRFDWGSLDEILEEDEPVYTHPRDPYTRVDVLASSRHVQVVIDGTKVADSHRPVMLFETGLPPRYYLPLSDLRMDLLRPSEAHTHCPYKGIATYWTVEIDGTRHEDAVWSYRSPLPESQKIAGLAAFYNERVDLYVDGELQERPRTKFS